MPAGERDDADLARRTLARLRAASRRTGSTARRRPEDETRSGAGADDRDPRLLGASIRELVADRGWEAEVTTGSVLARWDRLVGADVAAHCRPVALVGDELTLEAESTAWATQLRLLAGDIVQRLAAEVGPGVVRRLTVRGPTAPSWAHGPRRVRGRGPRDTYG